MDKKFFTVNRQKLIKQVGGLIVIPAHTQMQRSRDIAFEFEQDKNFWYLAGIDEPDYWLVMSPKETFLIRPTVSEVENWFEERSSDTQLSESSGIEQIMSLRRGRARLKELIAKNKKVHVLKPVNSRHMSTHPNPSRKSAAGWLKRNGATLQDEKLGKTLMNMRLVKQDQEIEQVRRAINVSTQAFGAIRQKIDSYSWEHEIEADFTAAFRRSGLEHGYTPIIGAGRNATVLHYTSNNSRLARGDMVLIDIGARSNYYSADITRTYRFGELSGFAKEVHAAVAAALQAGIKKAKPGVSYLDVEKTVETTLGQAMVDIGLIDEPTRENIRALYPHSGHFLGLDVHDVGDYRAPLRAGNVITIEPGIYIPDKSVGIRLEEDILITSDGCDVLSGSLPLDP